MASRFAQDISKFVRKTQLRADLVLRKVALDAYRGLLNRSPVKTGRFRGNWRCSIGTADLTTTTSVLPTGEDSAVVKTIGDAKFGDTILLSNNLPYAGVLEHGMPGVKYADGRVAHSAQAPTGVLQNTFDDLTNRFRQVVQAAEDEL